jgi:hypothetical protein
MSTDAYSHRRPPTSVVGRNGRARKIVRGDEENAMQSTTSKTPDEEKQKKKLLMIHIGATAQHTLAKHAGINFA